VPSVRFDQHASVWFEVVQFWFMSGRHRRIGDNRHSYLLRDSPILQQELMKTGEQTFTYHFQEEKVWQNHRPMPISDLSTRNARSGEADHGEPIPTMKAICNVRHV
jgi:hypothetical protein